MVLDFCSSTVVCSTENSLYIYFFYFEGKKKKASLQIISWCKIVMGFNGNIYYCRYQMLFEQKCKFKSDVQMEKIFLVLLRKWHLKHIIYITLTSVKISSSHLSPYLCLPIFHILQVPPPQLVINC